MEKNKLYSRQLPAKWRKMSLQERISFLKQTVPESLEFLSSLETSEFSKLSEKMVENAVGFLPVPLGIARGLQVDGKTYDVPMATEEPSVVAAASFAAGIIGRSGGFQTTATQPVMGVQLFLESRSDHEKEKADNDFGPVLKTKLKAVMPDILNAVKGPLENMTRRGGGYRNFEISKNDEAGFVRLQMYIDVRDAMGANLLNTCGEAAAAVIESKLGIKPIMAVLTNNADRRKAVAKFSLPFADLGRAKPVGMAGEEIARRIVLAAEIARHDTDRAVTHNKGIMNAVTALALATANDTRALEASVHAYACRDGVYRGLSCYNIENHSLTGHLELPVPLAITGGAVHVHPASRFALEMLQCKSSTDLGRVAVALGLAQNFAALLALTTEGIQKGHMRLHQRRLNNGD